MDSITAWTCGSSPRSGPITAPSVFRPIRSKLVAGMAVQNSARRHLGQDPDCRTWRGRPPGVGKNANPRRSKVRPSDVEIWSARSMSGASGASIRESRYRAISATACRISLGPENPCTTVFVVHRNSAKSAGPPRHGATKCMTSGSTAVVGWGRPLNSDRTRVTHRCSGSVRSSKALAGRVSSSSDFRSASSAPVARDANHLATRPVRAFP